MYIIAENTHTHEKVKPTCLSLILKFLIQRIRCVNCSSSCFTAVAKKIVSKWIKPHFMYCSLVLGADKIENHLPESRGTLFSHLAVNKDK